MKQATKRTTSETVKPNNRSGRSEPGAAKVSKKKAGKKKAG